MYHEYHDNVRLQKQLSLFWKKKLVHVTRQLVIHISFIRAKK
jgi:hypothetical protein